VFSTPQDIAGGYVFKKILLPTDGSELSRNAVEKGVAFAKSINCGVVGFFAVADYSALLYSEYIPPSLMSRDDFEANAKKAGEKQLAFVENAARSAGVPYEGFCVTSASPWEAILAAAQAKNCDLIFMASHGRTGLSKLVLGSQTAKVLTHSEIPVLVYR
jgi:nucleotide-binding universal stress UspA family protein